MYLTYICDKHRHLICQPYSVKNLHIMAHRLKIDRCWYRSRGKNYHPHFDIPKERVNEIMAKCVIKTRKEILEIIKSNTIPF